MLLETNGDFTFAATVEELRNETSRLNKALEYQLEVNDKLTTAIKQLTEVICEQNEQYQKILRTLGQNTDTSELLPDVILE
ncbi:hypothetical protein bpr_IV074 (plasmid) [Butyrivibrio proteoclasticus B316]|uniref:Uncharacterized protein n=1 Tax=Butyrivibrio proteoclasticus (strain ATCC 51982 / DSM 14932 / B316) TaxID=515622 RepID=E0S4V7_BUTPB|nr:hypothetical protein [Butyrivibrio proteoclasticus]ADL36439.1 hypothetical protein bpr_IV074 [Butyrivibrio proteoclasticus B316]